MEIPVHIYALFIALVVVVVVVIYRGLSIAVHSINHSNPKRFILRVTATLCLWLVALAILAYANFFAVWELLPPRVAIAAFLPTIVLLILYRTHRFRQLALAIPKSWPLYAQSFRILVEVILWMLFVEVLIPIQMTFEGYNFDILSGILGVVMGLIIYRKGLAYKRWAILYNIVGLGLLITIVTIAILSFPTPIRQFMNEPANQIVAYFPMIWLPGFLVPAALFFHLVSLKQLLSSKD